MNEKRQRDGSGVFYYHNGDCYEGEWKNDQKIGHGTYYWQVHPGKNLEWDTYPKNPSQACYDLKCHFNHK